ncbi:YveK family protein [Lacticaseibacillus zhaodongensis]|uniref:YveK family protein n=1 Tax=Lacticaseibacillus zhaodongensis TaxID=2668065 RepID=UPI0012D36A84|nr:Wzz/FepE/Etk N-terminal domain-containing protein [Lacticaseibacillus zhaodongensis]
MDNVIELTRLWNIIKRSFWLMIVLGIVCAAAAFGVSKFVLTPKYSASVAMLVNRKSDDQAANGVQYADQQANVQLISTYKDIITKPVILNKVANQLTNPHRVLVKKAVPAKTKRVWSEQDQRYYTTTTRKAQPAKYKLQPAKYSNIDAKKLSDEIAIANETNSQVFTVTVTDPSPSKAKDIANEIAAVFRTEVVKMMSVKNVSVVSKATTDDTPVSPKTKLITLAGLVLGILIGFVIGTVRELTDRAVKSIDFLTDDMGLVDLGVVSYIGKLNKKAPAEPAPAVDDDNKGEGRMQRRSSRRV